MSHSHKCGLVDWIETALTGLVAENGCGHVWRHDPVTIKTEEENVRAHHCPRCGQGPWYLKYGAHEGKFCILDCQ